jgi:DNA-binding GntR family transcriptional regulator
MPPEGLIGFTGDHEKRKTVIATHPRTISRASQRSRRPDSRSLTEQVVDALRDEIITGRLAPGETVNEPDLAERYGVSKTPVREALRLMAQDGWVLVLRRKGYLVRPLALDDIREIFALRRMLEPPLAGETARRAADDTVQQLRDLVAAQASIESDFERAIRSARDYHMLIAQLSGNARAIRIVSGLIDEVVRLIHLMPRLEENLRSVAELEAHERITEAIAQRDAEGAADLMRAHLVVAGREMTQTFGAGV